MEERRVLFGKYETGRLLGRGTFAKVYHAKHVVSGESVAVKVIAKDHVRESGMVDQIKREISAARLVRHPNVVELREVMATKSKIYIVMEHARGGELFAKVARGRLREDLARKYFQQLILAVDFCHSRGVSHRDLKPENLLVDAHGDLKVSDFGLSALPEQLRQDGLLHTRCGTPSYVAPEVLRKRGYDGAKADLWSCGVILYVLLAGFLPFKHDNVMKMYGKIFKAEFEFPPWFSPESRRLISKLLVADPAKRISIPAIMRVSWFRKNLNSQIKSSIEQSTVESEEKWRSESTSPSAIELSLESRSPTLSRQISSPIEQSVESEEESRTESKSPSSMEQSTVEPEETRSESRSPTSISSPIEQSAAEMEKSRSPKSSPAFLNAFEFISSMASGFDLSSMFESERRLATMFTSRCSAGAIMASVEAMAREAGFRVWRVKEFGMRMEGLEEGRRGRLLVAAQMFEVAEGVALVEITRIAGDTLEYDNFCRENVRPGLKDVVWTWQGDNFCNGDDDDNA